MPPRKRPKKRPPPPPPPKAPRPLVPDRYRTHLVVTVFVLGFVICGLFSLQIGQDNNWDLRNYHYYNPYAFLNDRIGHDFAPGQLQSYLNPIADLPYYFGMTSMDPKLFGFLMGGIHGLALGLIFLIAYELFSRLSANVRLILSLLCAALGIYAPIFIGELGASQNDTLTNLLVLWGLLLIVRRLTAEGTAASRAGRNALIVAGLLFGIGMGLKMTVLIFALGCGASLLIVERNWMDRATVALSFGLSFVAGLLICSGSWMLTLWQEFENPLFPFYNHIFQSPWTEIKDWSDNRWLPQTLWEALTRPFYFVTTTHYAQTQNDFRDARYAVIYVLLLLWLVIWFSRRYLFTSAQRKPSGGKSKQARAITLSGSDRFGSVEIFLLTYFVISFVIWEVKFSAIRYTASIETIGPMVIVILVYRLFRSATMRLALIGAAFVFVAVIARPIQHLRAPWGDRFWEVEVPRLEHPDDTMIIIASNRPWGYLLPEFQPEIRFVRVNSNFTHPGQPSRLQTEMRRAIDEHQGEFYLLSRFHPQLYNWLTHDRAVIANYGLAVSNETPLPIISKYSRPGLGLWPLKKG